MLFEYRAGFQMVETKLSNYLKTRPVLKWHLKIDPDFKELNHLKTELEKILMSEIQIPAVFELFSPFLF
jgi:hypothetical protein